MPQTTPDAPFSATQLRKAARYKRNVIKLQVATLVPLGAELYSVPSATNRERFYEVLVIGGKTADCNCQASGACWHMAAVAMRLRDELELAKLNTPRIFACAR
jgi:hypothetical protein